MIILGVDPGTNFTGCGVISISGASYSRVYNGLVKLKAADPIYIRLKIIYSEIDRLIKLYRPDEFSIETAFYGKNVQSAMKIGYARGVSILAAVNNNVPVNEYSPREIKKSLVGNGAASKEQVNYMIRTLLELKEEKMRLDESDALAAALCHAFRLKNPVSKKSKNWKAFVEANPDRIIY